MLASGGIWDEGGSVSRFGETTFGKGADKPGLPAGCPAGATRNPVAFRPYPGRNAISIAEQDWICHVPGLNPGSGPVALAFRYNPYTSMLLRKLVCLFLY